MTEGLDVPQGVIVVFLEAHLFVEAEVAREHQNHVADNEGPVAVRFLWVVEVRVGGRSNSAQLGLKLLPGGKHFPGRTNERHLFRVGLAVRFLDPLEVIGQLKAG